VSAARDFWLSCGHHLLDRDRDGRLLVTDEFLKVYLARPEITPPQEACAVERALHQDLLANPRRSVSREQVAHIADADARENWEVMLAFRDQLLRHATLESAYLDIVRRNLKFPHLFLNQVVHVVLRNVLDGCHDVFVLRAAEMLFRPQRLAEHQGSLVAADEEILSGLGRGQLSPLVSMLGLPAAAEIDVLSEDNADGYWRRSDQFDMALDLTSGRRGLAALGEVVKRWVGHLLGISVTIEQLTELQNVPLVWYVGLDADGTRIGDALWNGSDLADADRRRVVGLYRLTFDDPNDAVERFRGETAYLILAMSEEKVLRLKPQNLITGLPLRHVEALS
jgi:hypothetical protein